VVAAYDVDPGIVGRRVGSVTVRSVDALEAEMNKEPVDIGVLATPREAAQDGARRLIRAGVKAILNFAPVPLEVPPDVAVKHVNLTLELEALSYALRNR
jgi:redox-sensing transcriptional repressor